MMEQGLGPAPQQMQEEQQAAQQPQGQDAPGAEALPTPEMREAYNQVYGSTLTMLYSERFMPKAEQIIQNSPTPEAGVAQITSAIGARIFSAAQQSGDQIPPQVMLLVGWRVIQEVSDFARNDVGVEMSDEQVETALFMASEELRGMLGPGAVQSNASPEEQQQMLEMAGGEEGIQQRKQGIAQALVSRKGVPV